MRVILVDDNADHRLVCKLVLERRGYEVLTLKDNDDLLAKIRSFQPGLIFMDHDVPGITGMEAIRLIKADQGSRHIPVIFFSGNADIQQLAAEAGADDWLSKPFKVDQLVQIAANYR
ncbi:MAG TPA: response regulator [Puia sp.]|nr:response regulator [Puia sp.]